MDRFLMADEMLEASGECRWRSGSWGVGRQSAGGGDLPDSPRSGLGGLAVVSIPGLGQGCSWQRVQFLMGGVKRILGLCPFWVNLG